MIEWLTRQYRRRIVNVNVNIAVANVSALILTAIVVHYSRYLGISDDETLQIVAFTFVVDLCFDVCIYYALHWMANHWPRRPGKATPAVDDAMRPSFFWDATNVQFERMVLSPVFYITAIGLQKLTLLMDVDRAAATVIGYGTAIVVTRTVHTLWMLRQERRAREAAEGRLAENPGGRGVTPPGHEGEPSVKTMKAAS